MGSLVTFTGRGALALAAVTLAALWFAGSAHAVDAEIVEQEKVSDRLLELTIETPAFVEPTKVHVFLPTGYRADRRERWPVTYLTAGTMNNYDTFENLLGGQELTEDYPSIVVSPDGNSGYWSDWFNAGKLGPPMYETYVIDQLIPLIDSRFRTIQRRSARTIFGVSMGGYGATMLAARHPDLFVAAASLSGAVDSNLPANGAVLSLSSTFDGAPADAIYGPRSTQEIRWRGHNPTDLASNLRDVDLQVRTANGAPNPGIGEDLLSADSVSCVVEKGVHMASTNFHRRLEGLEIDHEWKDYGAGCHTPPNFRREVTDTLDAMEKVLADPPRRPREFDFRSIEPRFSVYDWKVFTDPNRAVEFQRLIDVSRRGLTVAGSGRTVIRSPELFKRAETVDVVTSDGRQTVTPDFRGHIRFSVDLGEPHPDQQYTSEARAAGQGTRGYFAMRKVRFKPHAR